MKIPKTLKIGAHTFKIVQKDNTGTTCMGECDTEKLTIFIRNDIAQSQQEETLIHEAIHAIREANKIDLPDKNLEEQQVQIMGHALYLFLKENDMLK